MTYNNANRLLIKTISACFALAVAFGPASVYAADIDVSRLDNSLERYAGSTVEFDAKLLYQVAGQYVNLIGVKRKLYFDARSALGKNIANDRDENGKKLRSKTSNLHVRAVIQRNSTRRNESAYIVVIESLTKLPDDVSWFNSQFDAQFKKDNTDYNSLLAITDRAKLWTKRYDAVELKQWTVDAEKRALDVWFNSISPEKLDERLRIAEQYMVRLNSPVAAIEAGQQVYESAKSDAARNRIAEKIGRWGGNFHRGKWIHIDAYYQSQGFIKYKGEWVLADEKEFAEFISANMNPTPVMTMYSADELSGLAARGEIAKAMSPIVVASVRLKSQPIGLPKFVRRKTIEVKGRKVTFMQWVFDDLRCYFKNNELIVWHKGKMNSRADKSSDSKSDGK